MSIEQNYNNLNATISTLKTDYDKFRGKNKAAGQRVRNNLLNARKLCDTLRKQIIEEMRTIPTKHRIGKIAEIKEPEPEPEPEEVEEPGQPEPPHVCEPEEKPKRVRKANKKNPK